jgi:hypothetical protein
MKPYSFNEIRTVDITNTKEKVASYGHSSPSKLVSALEMCNL